MDDLLKSLSLAPEWHGALTTGEGPGGEALRLAIAFEHGDWDTLESSHISNELFQTAYVDAISWADRMLSVHSQTGC